MKAFDFGPFNIEEMFNDIEKIKSQIDFIAEETKLDKKSLDNVKYETYQDIVKRNTKED